MGVGTVAVIILASTVEAAQDSTVEATPDSTVEATPDSTVEATLDSTVDTIMDVTLVLMDVLQEVPGQAHHLAAAVRSISESEHWILFFSVTLVFFG